MVYAAWHLGERTLYDTFDTSRMTQSSSTHAPEQIYTGVPSRSTVALIGVEQRDFFLSFIFFN